MKKTFLKNTSGFTLMEAIIAVALVVVLSMLAIPGTAALKRSLQTTEMEAGARLLFIAAQNRLTVMKSAGTLEQVDPLADPDLIDAGLAAWIPVDQMPADYDDSEGTWDGQTLCYATNRSSDGAPAPGKTITDILVPAGAADPTIMEGFYAIEYAPATGSVHGVFYSDAYFDYSVVSVTDRTREQLKSLAEQPLTGYYGGSASILPDVEDTDPSASDFIVENQERLTVRITPSSDMSYRLTIQERTTPEAYATYTYSFLGSQSEFTAYPNMALESGTGDILVTLDSLEAGSRFRDLFLPEGGKPAIPPGADLRITLTAEESAQFPSETTKVVNSLFAGRSDTRAMLSYARHLQNLEPGLSGVSGISEAVLQNTIDWDVAEAALFVPISNPELRYFDGQGNGIRNLAVSVNGERSGLFGEYSGSEPERKAIVNLYLADSTVYAGTADYAGTLAGVLSYTDVSQCKIYAEDPGTPTNGRLAASAADGAGGLAGASSFNTFRYSLASLQAIDVTLKGAAGTSAAGGFAGISNSDLFEYCYANTTAITTDTAGSYAYSGGFAGRSASTFRYSYSLGGIAQNGGTAATGFSFSYGSAFTSCYSATLFEGTSGLSQDSYGFSNTAASDCRYFSGADPTDSTAIAGILPATLLEMQSAYTGIHWRTPSVATSHPYDPALSGDPYPVSLAPTLHHYGNWPPEDEGGTLGGVDMAYYEVYFDTVASTYSIGFFNSRLSLNTLSEPSPGLQIVQDGYAVLFMKDPSASTASGVSYSNLTSDAYVRLSWIQNGTSDASTDRNFLKTPQDFRYNGSAITVTHQGTAIGSASTLNLSSGQYYYRFLSRNEVVEGDLARADFYQSLQIDVYPDTAELLGSVTLYYNPHFGKSPIAHDDAPATAGMAALPIRSFRHYVTLSQPEMSAYWSGGYTYYLENDLDFAANSYTTTYFDQAMIRRDGPQNIGNQTTAFRGIFEGNGHTVNQITLQPPADTGYYGIFGRTADAAVRNLAVNNISINQWGTQGISHVGGLIGEGTRTDIVNVTLNNVALRGKYMVGGAAGRLDGGTVTGLEVGGNVSINASRLAGGVFGQVSNASAVTLSDVALSGLNLQLPSWNGEDGGLTAATPHVSGAYGTGGIIGAIASFSGADNDISIQNVTLGSSSIQQNALTGATEAKYYAAGFLAGNYYAAGGLTDLTIGGVSVTGTTLHAYPTGGENAGAAYGGYIGKVYAGGTLTLANDCDIDATCGIQRNTTDPGNIVGMGGYFGWISGYGAAAPLRVALLEEAGAHTFSAHYGNSSAWSYLPGTHMGGIAGVIGLDTGFASVAIDGISINGFGGNTGGLAGMLYADLSDVTVDNVNLVVETATATSNTGGFAGLIINAAIDHCDVRLSDLLNSSSDPLDITDWAYSPPYYVRAMGSVGGFAGRIEGSSSFIDSCFAATGVTTHGTRTANNLGGFAGVLDSGRITNSYASGYVRMHVNDQNSNRQAATGGFVGRLMNTTGAAARPLISQCYSTGRVKHGLSYANAGFCGWQEAGILDACYTTGPVLVISNSQSTYRRGLSNHNTTYPADAGYPNSLYYANQPNSPGGGRSAFTGSLSRVTAVANLGQIRTQMLNSGYYGGFATTVAAMPYYGALGGTFPYLGLTGVGRNVTGALHYGNWVAP